jgi:hypothetical protein
MGFDNLVFARIDIHEKYFRQNTKRMEFYWRPNFSFDKGATKIFTHILLDHYTPPADTGLANLLLDDEQAGDTESKVFELAKWAENTKSIFLTNQRLILLGDDFSFKDAERTFRKTELVMEFVRKNPIYSRKIRLVYSSAEKYFNSLRSSNAEFPDYNDNDFYPYCFPKLNYWTGFFTSRPFLKGLVRASGKYLSSASKLFLEQIFSQKINKITKHK